MSLTVSDCGESSSRSRAHERSQLEETELQGPKKRRRSVRGRRSSVLLREGDSADCEKVVVSLNEEENASVHGNNAASKLAAVEREIAELKDYYLELQYEQKQWNELLDEKQRDVEKASSLRDNGPKETIIT
uniref:Uncharacterized protein n=1 Tax=Parascaris univalens TaxID=6257 RepID=A0A915C0Y3_PARUN